MIKGKGVGKLVRLGSLLLFFLFVIGCATTSNPFKSQTYEEWLLTCKDYKDVAKWQERYLVYDIQKLKETVYKAETKQPQTPTNSHEETFKLKRGVCRDAAVFSKVSLNRINPEYKAEIVHLYPGPLPLIDHYVCAFYVDGKLFIMDYGTTSRSTMGTHGPFKDLEDYVNNFYLRYHPKHRSLKWYRFGWPPWRSFEPW